MKKFNFTNRGGGLKPLTRTELKNVFGGNPNSSSYTSCSVKCDKNSKDAAYIENCEKATVEAKCGSTADYLCFCATFD